MHNIALAENDLDYQNTMNAGNLVFTDGVPVVWAANRLHPQHKWERVYGPDVTSWILENQELGKTARHYCLGATPDTMNKLLNQIAKRFPTAQVVGHDCPPFREPTAQELNERDQRIKDSGATVVWVGLGTPKQDFEVQRFAYNPPVTAIAGGAAFDFLAETVPQAPQWIQKSGLDGVIGLPRNQGALRNGTSGATRNSSSQYSHTETTRSPTSPKDPAAEPCHAPP